MSTTTLASSDGALSGRGSRLPLALLILTLSAFAIGTSEFVVMGLLPDVAGSLSVSIPAAGWLVTGYALGVAIGGPIMALLTARMPRKRSLLMLMTIFAVGNALCAIAPTYGYLMIARVVTALCQGAFYGIGAVVAASLVPEHRRASAVAMIFTGLTLANVLGVPIGTALGQWAGWQAPFWAITGLGVLAFAGLWIVLPNRHDEEHIDIAAEIRALASGGIWAALLATVVFDTSMFAIFTYVAPLLGEVTHVPPHGVTLSLLSIGVGLTVGNYFGGRLADWSLSRALTLIALAIAVVTLALRWTSPLLVPAELNWFVWGVVMFAAIPALQVNVMRFGQKAPNLVSTLNIGAFNVGNALGAWVGGTVLSLGFGLLALPVTAALLAVAAILCVRFSDSFAKRNAL